MYSEGNIVFNSGKTITEVGKENGITYGEPKDPPPPPLTNKKIVDIIMFVAGTTDPINIKGKKHQANKNYWRDSQKNFWAKVKELKPQIHDLHIEDTFFSWSGDNNTEERKLAADRLLDLFVRVYPRFKNEEAHLHLIGHSHGGNVINQFTDLIAADKRFPKLWKTKSITYLSTPFFQKKHQLNHAKLHKNCKIINVHNEYDLTQRLVADFSLVNLEIFLRNFQMEKFQKGMDTLKSVNTSAFDVLISTYVEDDKEGPLLWKETAKDLLYGDYPENNAEIERLRIEIYNEEYNRSLKAENKDWLKTKEETAAFSAKKISDLRITKIKDFLKKDNTKLFEIFNDDMWYFSSGDLKDVAHDMVAKVKANKGGEYSDDRLSHAVANHEKSVVFLSTIKETIKEYLKQNHGNIGKLEIIDDSKGVLYPIIKNKKVDSPRFSDKTTGLGITINDVWAYQVYIKKYEVNGTKFEMELEYFYWDHFGLDYPDIHKFDNDIFAAWFILQHFRGYKPLITKIGLVEKLKGIL